MTCYTSTLQVQIEYLVKVFISLRIVEDISVALMRGCLPTELTILCITLRISGMISSVNVNAGTEVTVNLLLKIH